MVSVAKGGSAVTLPRRGAQRVAGGQRRAFGAAQPPVRKSRNQEALEGPGGHARQAKPDLQNAEARHGIAGCSRMEWSLGPATQPGEYKS